MAKLNILSLVSLDEQKLMADDVDQFGSCAMVVTVDREGRVSAKRFVSNEMLFKAGSTTPAEKPSLLSKAFSVIRGGKG